MVSDDVDDTLFKKHTDLCNKLNLDSKTVTESWENFQTFNKNYTLEGEPLHWLGCAVFVACRKTVTLTVSQATIEGNCINLTSLLRYCNLNLTQFFCNMHKWADMANLSDDLRRKIDYLEQTFAITYAVFKKYCTIYMKIFKPPEPSDIDVTKQHRNRKQRSLQCTSWKIFEFGWNLYIAIRGRDSNYSSDVVQSSHLLVVICDLIFKNAYLTKRKDLISPHFEGWSTEYLNNSFSFETLDEVPCIIDKISDSSDTVEAKYIKQYKCKDVLNIYFKDGILVGNCENFSGLFEPIVFDSNVKSITKVYEMQLLNKGGFDERILLAEYKRRILEREHETQYNLTMSQLESEDNDATDSPAKNNQGNLRGFDTPLTGRRFLSARNDFESMNSSTSTQGITRLQTLLSGKKPAPSETLQLLLQSCSINPFPRIETIITNLGEKFVAGYVGSNAVNTEELTEFARNRLQLGITLFYKLTEGIFEHEKTINRDLTILVEKNIFYECVFACCMEIILYSYNSDKKFPWILNTLEMRCCDFVKVIELIVRSKDPFYRDTIKHLSKIEEMILESLAWESTSELWDLIAKSEGGIPKLEEIALPNLISYGENGQNISSDQQVNSEVVPSQLQSPIPSATDQFQSPVSGQNSNVNRQLFPVNQGGQSLLQKHTHLMFTDKDGNRRLIPIVETKQEQPSEEAARASSPAKPKKTGSLPIFFRKFYNLAAERMEHLCARLNIVEFELKRKIWTVFEDAIRNHSEVLLKDRHLDQLLMCSVYVICRVSDNIHAFAKIMKCYREQPQADSNIYRNVLLKNKVTENIDGQIVETAEQRGDLIHFYNSIYIGVMTSFAVKFQCHSGSNTADIFLSPLPLPYSKRNLISPSIQVARNVFVKPMDGPNTQFIGAKSYNYFFSRSPSKDLKDINRAISSNGVSGKRLLVDDEVDSMNTSSKRICNRKVQCLLEERRSQHIEDKN